MRFVLVAMATAVAVAVPCPAVAKDAMAASTPWELNYDTDSCALRRMFGEGENRAYIEMRRFQPGLGLQAVVASDRMNARNPARFKYRFGDGDWREATMANVLDMADGFSGVLFEPELVDLSEYDELKDARERHAAFQSLDLKAMERAAATAADAITLRGAFSSELSLQLGSLEKPIAALNQCVEELTTHWGIDVEAHKTLTRPALPTNLREVPRMMDYPPKMVRQRMPGVVNVRLAIDERGLITDCHIQMPLSDPAFEASSCADIQHALEFDPALDKDGKPIPSYYVTRVVFQIAG